MSYGGPSRAAGIAFSKKLAEIEKAKERAEQQEAYAAEKAEARACGYEFPSFAEWSGEVSSRSLAEARLAREEYIEEMGWEERE